MAAVHDGEMACGREGIAMLYISMPYYNERRPKSGLHERMITDDPRLTIGCAAADGDGHPPGQGDAGIASGN